MAHAYAAVIDAIYAAAAEPGSWPTALERVADHVGGTGGMLVFNDIANNTGVLTTARLREDLGRVYVRDHIRNPVTQAMVGQPIGVPVAASRLIGREQLRRSALYADIIAPQRIADLVCVAQSSLTRQGTTGGVAITVDERQADQLAPLTARLTRLAPHLARAADLSFAVGQARARLGAMTALIEAMLNPALLLDGQARLRCANAAAARLLDANDGIGLGSGGRLVASLAHNRSRLDECLARALADAAARPHAVPPTVKLDRPSGRSGYLVHLTLLPPQASALRGMVTHEARLLVQVIDPAAPLAVAARHLRTALDLTWAEARVAVLVGSGRSVPEAAAALGIGASTAKTHLARCFDKTGAHSQVALARLLAAMPGAGEQPGPAKR